MTPLQCAMRHYPQWKSNSRLPSLGRIVLFLLVQMLALFVIFWAGIVALVGAIWHADPSYIGIFILLVTGFELLMLRIIVRHRLLTVLGIASLVCGFWLHHHDSKIYDIQTCHFIKNATCQPFGNGFLCRQELHNFVNERTISRGDISACAALDEF